VGVWREDAEGSLLWAGRVTVAVRVAKWYRERWDYEDSVVLNVPISEHSYEIFREYHAKHKQCSRLRLPFCLGVKLGLSYYG
jgi:hypothetical protein